MKQKRYLRRKGSRHIYHWTETLAKEPDMVECDANGQPIVPREIAADMPRGLSPVAPQSPNPAAPVPPPAADTSGESITITAEQFEKADRDGLLAIAKTLKIGVHPAAKEETIREKIRAVLFPEE